MSLNTTKSHEELTTLLRDALSTLGRDKLQALLPPPLKLMLSSHDTGCQCTIAAEEPGRAWLELWAGSIWYASGYSTGRQRPYGMNPQAAWAGPVLAQFFDTVDKLHAEHVAERTLAKAGGQAKASEKVRSDAEYYRSLFEAAPGAAPPRPRGPQ